MFFLCTEEKNGGFWLAFTILASETGTRVKNAWKNQSKDEKSKLKQEEKISEIMKIEENAEKIKCPLDMNWQEDKDVTHRNFYGNYAIELIDNEKFFRDCSKEDLESLMLLNTFTKKDIKNCSKKNLKLLLNKPSLKDEKLEFLIEKENYNEKELKLLMEKISENCSERGLKILKKESTKKL